MMHKGYYYHERRKRMDQIKIGGFIAEERKRKGYTQKILSEKLGISDKTISKWERGVSQTKRY